MAMLEGDLTRLRKLDDLYKLRLDKYVQLPIIVVTGDQSSGKSSVLEALTGLPLPRDSTLCTRHPTNITFKRSSEERLEVTISPQDKDRASSTPSPEDFSEWAKRFNKPPHLDNGGFKQILEKAASAMGLPQLRDAKIDGQLAFSHDVLNIDLYGPNYEHFGVVDLPGIFRYASKGQTTMQDADYVRKIVAGYLNNQRAIILAVVPANNDIATQEIVQLTEEADPRRTRTLGVFTKPDLVDQGAEGNVIDLIVNANSAEDLGWVVVCNRKQAERDAPIQTRHEKEIQFFGKDPWSEIPSDRAGIKSLRLRVNSLLVDMSRTQFDNVLADIEKLLASKKQELLKMSRPRDTPALQRSFLTHAAGEFRSVTERAIDGYCHRNNFFAKCPALRLSTIVRTKNEAFSDEMALFGASRPFISDPRFESSSEPRPESSSSMSMTSETGDHRPAKRARAETGREGPSPEASYLRIQFNIPKDLPPKRNDTIKDWIRCRYEEFRGFELGMPNPTIVPTLFSEQVETWKYYTMEHMVSVVSSIVKFIKELLQLVFGDRFVADQVWRGIQPEVQKTFTTALKHAEFLLETETSTRLVTMNHYFADNLSKARERRALDKYNSLPVWDSTDDRRLINMDDLRDSYSTNEDAIIDDVHDILQAYHKVARKRFVDSVCVQAIDRYLLCEPYTPLGIFSSEWVSQLDNEKLETLAGEKPDVARTRKRIQNEVDGLEKGIQVLLS